MAGSSFRSFWYISQNSSKHKFLTFLYILMFIHYNCRWLSLETNPFQTWVVYVLLFSLINKLAAYNFSCSVFFFILSSIIRFNSTFLCRKFWIFFTLVECGKKFSSFEISRLICFPFKYYPTIIIKFYSIH